MSILSPEDNARAAQGVVDEAIDHVGKDAPGWVERALAALTEFELVIGLRRKAQ